MPKRKTTPKKRTGKKTSKNNQPPFFSRLSILFIVALAGFITFYFWDESQTHKPKPVKQTVVTPVQKPNINPSPTPEIMLVMGEMGVDRIATSRANLLPREVTLSFLSFAPKVKRQVEEARHMGHEVLIQIPLDNSVDAKANPLMASLTPDQLAKNLQWHLTQFDGYIGVTNYGGAVFSKNRGAVDYFLNELKKRSLLYLDNPANKGSLMPKIARARSMSFLNADVRVYKAYDEELRKAEILAKKRGRAIVLCPLNNKILMKVENWVRSLPGKNIRLVPLSGVTLPWKK